MLVAVLVTGATVVLAVVLSVMVRAVVEVISAQSVQVNDVVERAGVHAQCPHFKRRSERLPQAFSSFSSDQLRSL